MALRQAKSAFGTESGTEATHGTLPNNPTAYSGNIAAGDVNQNITRSGLDETTFFVRFLIQSDASTAGTNSAPQLQYSKNGGAYTNVTTTSANIRAVTTAIFADAAATTARLQGTGTFESSSQGCSHDGLAGGAQMDIVANGNAETLYSVRLVAADLANGDTIDLRMSVTPTAITVYDFTPRITISLPTPKSGSDTVAAGVTDSGVLAAALASSDSIDVGVTDSGQVDTGAVSKESSDTVAASTSESGVLAAALASSDTIAVSTTESGQVETGVAKESSDTIAVSVSDTGLVAIVEPILPNAVVASSNLQDMDLVAPPADTTDIDDDPTSPDADWWTAVNASVGTSCTIGFASPTMGQPIGEQQFRIRVRKTAGDPNPIANGWLRDDGARVRQIITNVPITSTVGQLLEPTWDASELSTPSGANVELELIFTAGV